MTANQAPAGAASPTAAENTAPAAARTAGADTDRPAPSYSLKVSPVGESASPSSSPAITNPPPRTMTDEERALRARVDAWLRKPPR